MNTAEQNYAQGTASRLQVFEEINEHKVSIDRSVFVKSKEEKKEVKDAQLAFKYNGLFDWNDRNRPGNNKKN